MRILLLKPKHIGDSLLLTPTIVALKRARPGAEIWVVVRRGCEGILAGCPEIDRLLTIARGGKARAPLRRFRRGARHDPAAAGREIRLCFRARRWPSCPPARFAVPHGPPVLSSTRHDAEKKRVTPVRGHLPFRLGDVPSRGERLLYRGPNFFRCRSRSRRCVSTGLPRASGRRPPTLPILP